MSYEGYSELLCLRGHYTAHDAYQSSPAKCHCGAHFRWSHGVDQTNGYDESEPYSCDGPKSEIGHEDVWHEDHLGNRYATKLLMFAPLGDHIWVRINSRGHATPPYEDDLAQGIETAKPPRREDGLAREGESPVANGDASGSTPSPHIQVIDFERNPATHKPSRVAPSRPFG